MPIFPCYESHKDVKSYLSLYLTLNEPPLPYSQFSVVFLRYNFYTFICKLETYSMNLLAACFHEINKIIELHNDIY